MRQEEKPTSITSVAVTLVFVICCTLRVQAAEGTSGNPVYDRLADEVFGEVMAGNGPALESVRPPASALEPADVSDTAGRKGKLALSMSYLVLSTEEGSAQRFAGGGRGFELRGDFHRPSGWGWMVLWSRADKDLWSTVDDTPVSVDRFLVGGRYQPSAEKRFIIAPEAGVAWNQINFDGEPSEKAIKGLGGFLGIQVALRLGGNSQVGVGGRIVAWQGEDGLGNTGDEFSTTGGLFFAASF